MRRDYVLSTLRASRRSLAALGAGELYLFGSVARDEGQTGSDVDLLVEPANPEFSIFDLALLKRQLEDILSTRVDLHDYGGYRRLSAVRQAIAEDIVRVF